MTLSPGWRASQAITAVQRPQAWTAAAATAGHRGTVGAILAPARVPVCVGARVLPALAALTETLGAAAAAAVVAGAHTAAGTTAAAEAAATVPAGEVAGSTTPGITSALAHAPPDGVGNLAHSQTMGHCPCEAAPLCRHGCLPCCARHARRCAFSKKLPFHASLLLPALDELRGERDCLRGSRLSLCHLCDFLETSGLAEIESQRDGLWVCSVRPG